jgi:hypothetical protein
MAAASNYTWVDVLSAAGGQHNRLVEDRNAATICNLCLNAVWDAYDFRETKSTLPPFFLIPNRQDHGPPFNTVPSDFKGLRQARVAYISATPPSFWHLNPQKNLSLTQARHLPHAISYQADTRSFRLFPRVPTNIGAPRYQVEGTYKKNAPKIVSSGLDTKLPFDDEHVEVFIDGVKWAAWKLASDPRAGQVQEQNGIVILTGQMGQFANAINNMAAEYGLNDGDQNVAPAYPLVDQGLYTPWGHPGNFSLW